MSTTSKRALVRDAVREANKGPQPAKLPGTVNVVVFDDTQTNPRPNETVRPEDAPFRVRDVTSLTFWWKTGGLIDELQGFADDAIGASNWDEAIDAAVSFAKRRRAKIGSLQFWGHGSDGAVHMGSESLTARDFGSGGRHEAALAELRAVMHPQQGSVWFRSCNNFRKERGRELARASVAFLGVPVVGHTFITHALQSGTMALHPGEAPFWDEDLGVRRKPRNGRDTLISDPLRKRTVTMFRYYPPMTRAEALPGSNLVNLVKRIFVL